MLPLFALTILLVLYGTLYPFALDHAAHFGDILPRFIRSMHSHPVRGDVLSNLVLFMPVGFFGMQSLLQRAPRLARLLAVCLLGAALSFCIECTQTFIVSRDTSLFDFLLNSTGTFLGACAGWFSWNRRLAEDLKNHQPASLFPVVLIAAWLGVRLFPYVPTIDFQHVKDAIKPLLTGDIVFIDVLRHFIVCLVIGRLLQALLPPHRALVAMPLIVLGAIAAKPFVTTQVLNLSDIIGSILAVMLWFTVFAKLRARTGILAALLAVQITVQGIAPFAWADSSSAFSFVPFKGLESGSMAVNLQSFLEKLFLYGSLVWLMVQSRLKIGLAVTIAVFLLTAIELVQTQLAGPISEITDPLLAVIMGVVLYQLERSQLVAETPGQIAEIPTRDAHQRRSPETLARDTSQRN